MANQPLSLTEAAEELGLNPGSLRVQVHNGKLKAKKLGPIWTVTRAEVERYRRESLRAGTAQSAVPAPARRTA